MVRQRLIDARKEFDRVALHGFSERAELDQIKPTDSGLDDRDETLPASEPVSQLGLRQTSRPPSCNQNRKEGRVGLAEL